MIIIKKVLVTGAAGIIGNSVIKYLLLEGKYEITALDLKNKNNMQSLKKYKRRINILYGDVNDRILMESLVKDQDYIIHLASVMPPLSDMKKGLAEAIDYSGTENIIRAMSYYNPKGHLFYASSTSIYKYIDRPSVKSKVTLKDYDYFEVAKINSEKLIKSKLKNYTIYRIPLVLSDPLKDMFIYHGKKTDMMDVITKEDVASSFVRGLKYSDELNKKIFNLKTDSILYEDLLNKILSINGLSLNYVLARVFLEKNYKSPVCSDSSELNAIINYQTDSIDAYYKRLKRKSRGRKVQKVLAKPFIKKEDK